eukprot:5191703-Ditylum_brightwellii.AAC.1
MGQKGLNPSTTADIQQLQVSDYITLICPLQDSTEEDGKRMKAVFVTLAFACYDYFNYVVNGAPWDPNVIPPLNNITIAYVAAACVNISSYKKSSDKTSEP